MLAVVPGVLILSLLVSNLVAQAQRSTSSSAKFGPSQSSHDLNVLHVIEKLLYVRRTDFLVEGKYLKAQ